MASCSINISGPAATIPPPHNHNYCLCRKLRFSQCGADAFPSCWQQDMGGEEGREGSHRTVRYGVAQLIFSNSATQRARPNPHHLLFVVGNCDFRTAASSRGHVDGAWNLRSSLPTRTT